MLIDEQARKQAFKLDSVLSSFSSSSKRVIKFNCLHFIFHITSLSLVLTAVWIHTWFLQLLPQLLPQSLYRSAHLLSHPIYCVFQEASAIIFPVPPLNVTCLDGSPTFQDTLVSTVHKTLCDGGHEGCLPPHLHLLHALPAHGTPWLWQY